MRLYLQAYPDDEHELIAAYAHQLANTPEAKHMEAMSSHSRNLVRELERKNREIMRDIHHLKRAHRNQRIMQMPQTSASAAEPLIVSELEVSTNCICEFWYVYLLVCHVPFPAKGAGEGCRILTAPSGKPHDRPTDLFFRLNTLCTHLSGSYL